MGIPLTSLSTPKYKGVVAPVNHMEDEARVIVQIMN